MSSIPNKAQKVFDGVIFDVYQWQETMYDGSSATFEALRRPATIQILPTASDTIFISNEEQPTKPRCLTLLGGRLEEGEDPLACAKRELMEEAGMESADWELYKVYDYEGKIDWQTYLFIARNCQKVAEPNLDAGEKIEVKSVNFDEFIHLLTMENFWVHRDIVIDLFRMKERDELEQFKQKLIGER